MGFRIRLSDDDSKTVDGGDLVIGPCCRSKSVQPSWVTTPPFSMAVYFLDNLI